MHACDRPCSDNSSEHNVNGDDNYNGSDDDNGTDEVNNDDSNY